MAVSLIIGIAAAGTIGRIDVSGDIHLANQSTALTPASTDRYEGKEDKLVAYGEAPAEEDHVSEGEPCLKFKKMVDKMIQTMSFKHG